MTAITLIKDLARLGIQLKADGDRLRYAPRSAVTPALVEQIKAHKGELLEILRNPTACPEMTLRDTASASPAASEQLSGNPPTCDTGTEHDLGPLGPDGWPVNYVDPAGLTTCPQCDTLELWQSLAGNWHCQNCNPPDKARQLRELAQRLKTAAQIGPSSTQRTAHGSEHLQHFRA